MKRVMLYLARCVLLFALAYLLALMWRYNDSAKTFASAIITTGFLIFTDFLEWLWARPFRHKLWAAIKHRKAIREYREWLKTHPEPNQPWVFKKDGKTYEIEPLKWR